MDVATVGPVWQPVPSCYTLVRPPARHADASVRGRRAFTPESRVACLLRGCHLPPGETCADVIDIYHRSYLFIHFSRHWHCYFAAHFPYNGIISSTKEQHGASRGSRSNPATLWTLSCPRAVHEARKREKATCAVLSRIRICEMSYTYTCLANRQRKCNLH